MAEFLWQLQRKWETKVASFLFWGELLILNLSGIRTKLFEGMFELYWKIMESSGDLNLKASHGSKVATDYSPLQKYEQFMD